MMIESSLFMFAKSAFIKCYETLHLNILVDILVS